MVMTDEDMKLVIAFAKWIVFPMVGFLAGFFVQWFLQSRKSRDELLNALAIERATAFQKLWQCTVLPEDIRRMKGEAIIRQEFLREKDGELHAWYYGRANALLLSWRTTRRLFEVWDVLRSDYPFKGRVEKAFSRLRTGLKRDCGIYTGWNAWRRLPAPRPRPGSWPD